jgi:hypothetical protein
MEATTSAPAEPAQTPKAPRAPRKAPGVKKTPSKRAAARPYRKLAQDVLLLRIDKLQKRAKKATEQLDGANEYLFKYIRERDIRSTEPDAPAEPVEAAAEPQ